MHKTFLGLRRSNCWLLGSPCHYFFTQHSLSRLNKIKLTAQVLFLTKKMEKKNEMCKMRKRIKNETYETYSKLGIFQILNEFCTYFKLDSILSPSPPSHPWWKSLRGMASFPRSVVVVAGVDVSLPNSTFNFWPGGATTTASKKYKKIFFDGKVAYGSTF